MSSSCQVLVKSLSSARMEFFVCQVLVKSLSSSCQQPKNSVLPGPIYRACPRVAPRRPRHAFAGRSLAVALRRHCRALVARLPGSEARTESCLVLVKFLSSPCQVPEWSSSFVRFLPSLCQVLVNNRKIKFGQGRSTSLVPASRPAARATLLQGEVWQWHCVAIVGRW